MKSLCWKAAPALAGLFSLACSESHGGTSNNQGPSELFAFPVRFPLGSGTPGRFTHGDLDRDGVVDVAVPLVDSIAGGPSSVVLSYLDGRGHLARTVELVDVRRPLDVTIEDCNGDRRADVLALDGHGEVLVYLQQGDGTFGVPLPFAVGEGPFKMIVARWDADATNDILTVNERGQSVCVLLGRGDGTFEPARFSAIGQFGLRDADAGDLDGDGTLDLALVHSNGGEFLLGTGDGRFGMPQPLQFGFGVTSVRVADVTGDGLVDILQTSCNSQDLVVLEGDGTGSFTPGFNYFAPCLSAVETGDLDGDGIVDLAVSNFEGITPLLGLGDGDFAPGSVFSPGGFPMDFAFWDANGDLDLDLLSLVLDSDGITRAATDLTVLAGKGDGTFEGPCAYAAGPQSRGLVVGDFVRDGVPDLAVLNETQSVSILGGEGNGSFLAPIETPLTGNPISLVTADLDGNTLDDLLVGLDDFRVGELAFLSSTGTGSFDPQDTFNAGGLGPTAIRVADLDSDSTPDVVVSNSNSNQIAVHLGLPGGFSKPMRFGVGAFPLDLELRDLDRDGNLDAVVANQSEDSVSVLIGNGDGTFQPDVVVPAFTGPQQIEVGDFDEDGLDDLAIACIDNQGESQIVLLSGLGDGTFIPRQLIPGVAANVFRLTAADLNRDGFLDLVTASPSAVFLQIADGVATYEPARTHLTTRFIGGVQVVDLDADGKEDLVLGAGEQALVFLNQGP